MKKIMSFKQVQEVLDIYPANFDELDLDKPVVAKLDYLGWGKSTNLFLLFSYEHVQFRCSVFHSTKYSPRDKSMSFNNIELLNKNIELLLSITKNGNIDVKSAKIV